MANVRPDNGRSIVKLLQHLVTWNQHTCPWWFGYTFDNPLRRYIHDPRALFHDLVSEGDVVADLGCGLGYFTLALADLVGPSGRVVAVDVQSQMLERTRRRAQRRGLDARIEFHQCSHESLGLTGVFDFVLAFWMFHEVRNRRGFLGEVRSVLGPDGCLLIAEPKGHVPRSLFSRERQLATEAGFDVREGPKVRFSRSVLCVPAGRTSAT